MEPHVYQMSRFVKIVYCVMGLFSIGAGGFFLLKFGWGALIIAIPLCLPSIYLWRWALLSRLTLSETEISVRYASEENSVRLSEIEGWRTENQGRGGTFWALQLKDDAGEFTIDQRFAVDDAFLDFLSKLRDLNELAISIAP